MKKIIILISIVLTASFIILGDAPSITVDSPLLNDVWYKGNEYKISWYVNHTITADVKIRLYSADGNTKIKEISNGTDIDKDFKWTIPDDIVENCYIIKVKTIDNDYFDNSSIFSIKNKKKINFPKEPIEFIKADLNVTNIFKGKDCSIWITVKNSGMIKIDRVMIEKIWINGSLKSQQKTHFVLTAGAEFSHQIPGHYAKLFGTTIKVFIDSNPPLDEITKSNNTLEKTLKCIRVFKEKIKR